MSSLNPSELKSLISLLDDNDPEVFSHIEEKIVTLGKQVIPVLEDVWSKSFDALLQQRVENIIHKIQFQTLKENLKTWRDENENDLLAGIILIARYQYPDLDEKKIHHFLDKIAGEAMYEVKSFLPPAEKINALNKILFNVYGFNGNTANFHSPQNSFINTVLETRKGNPLMLSVVYSLLAKQLGINCSGVNLPEHFILAYIEKSSTQAIEYTNPEAGIVFYINAFSRGSVFGKKDIDKFLQKLNLKPEKHFYEPCRNREIIFRSLRNLALSYQKLGDMEKENELQELLEYISSEK